MDDSGQDFVDLSAKLLKRVRKKPGERTQRKAENQSDSQANDGDKRRRNNKKDSDSASMCTGTQSVGPAAEAKKSVVCGGIGHDSGDAESSVVSSAAAGQRVERSVTVKEKVLQRMQQFKRASPHRMQHMDRNHAYPPPALGLTQDTPESFSSGLLAQSQDSDEALALQLQQELDREAAEAQIMDLEDGGLFFCQICHRDLSHMTPEGRAQHLNRCLDESEESGPPPPPQPPGVPDCPICGKKFKSQKNRLSHLKRCSSDMGVAPTVLLQAVQRQTEETQSAFTIITNTTTQTAGTKRKGPAKPAPTAGKKPRKKSPPLDEDTMVALALSESLLEQQQQNYRELEGLIHTNTAASHGLTTPGLKWRPDIGKGRGKRKKGAVPLPPPLLLVQDAEVALRRLQERVSALLLRSRAPSPPTPTRCPSSLSGWSGAAPLWQRSTQLDRGCLSDFYTPELREFITPWESAATDAATSSAITKPESVPHVSEGTPGTGTVSNQLSSTQRTEQLPDSAELLMDLMELAEGGTTLTQCSNTASGPVKDRSGSQITNLRLSGFVLEESEEQADLCVSGFLPQTTHTHSEDACSQLRRTTGQPAADGETSSHRSVALSRLASDLSSMVNNPQLSDLQLQVDSGEVYFAHSFMVYARCPLLAEMVHESGFGVQEEGVPPAQRVLLNDIPGKAVFALLQYLYTARCSVSASLQPHVLELASRFDLQELQQLCELHREDAAATQGDEEEDSYQGDNVNSQTHQDLTELLRSMWEEGDEDERGTDTEGRSDQERGLEESHQAHELASGDGEIHDEKVNEEELEEIYEFAATQRKREETDSTEEEKVEEEEDGEEVFAKLAEPQRSLTVCRVKNTQLGASMEGSYSRLFSESFGVYEEGDSPALPSTSSRPTANTPETRQQSPQKPELSGRALLQSSASLVEELSLSPPPTTSSLPAPGQSPGQGDEGADGLASKRESQGPRSICVPLSPQEKKEPELIVLSDSSEEMEVNLNFSSPSPCAPGHVQKPQSYTQIKPSLILKPNEPTVRNKQSDSLQFSPDDASAEPVLSPLSPWCDQNPVDCSAEVSWLIPCTPVQSGRRTSSSSTQTKSSICKTQLFPKGNSSSSSNRLQTSNSPARVSSLVGPAEGSVSKLKLEDTCCDLSKDEGSFAFPPSQPKLSISTSSKQDTPRHIQAQPHSSTPLLHMELHKAPILPSASPLHRSQDEMLKSQGRDRGSSESPEKTELGSFHLSPLSDPPFSSSHRGPESSQRHSKSSTGGQRSFESSAHNSSESELKKAGSSSEGGEGEFENKHTGDGGAQEEEQTEGAESSFRQSFMDEPPIAFNDSWGFGACDELEVNPVCFSLRLEDSGASSQQGERSLGQRDTSNACPPSPYSHSGHSSNSHVSADASSPSKAHRTPPGPQAHTGQSFSPSPPHSTTNTPPEISNSLLDSKIWDSWEEEEEEALPLSQRVNPSAQLKTPLSRNKRRRTLVPITPMPHYSDMDTPELKNKLNRFGVRPLPKRQMILKLKEIHQYTHQLSSDSEEEEAPPAGRTARTNPPSTSSVAPHSKPASCVQRAKFKEPRAPAAVSPLKTSREEEAELLSASQGSNTSSTAASDQSDSSSSPELNLPSDSDSEDDISASQTANRLQDRLLAVRSFILSDSGLYNQILQYQPLVLSQLQEQLKAAGIRLGAAKLVDYLDSQCITFTTAKPGQAAPTRRRGKRKKAAGESAAGRKRAATALI